MSSNYVIICVSHDPAIEICDWEQYHSPNDALAAAHKRVGPEFLNPHQHCDLLVGRYSGALIEIACPSGDACRYHRFDYDSWTDVGWLRLLYAAHARGDDLTALRIPQCWTRQRVLRLGQLLDMSPEGART